ncbi:Exonuclease family protein [Leishmania donovani]|uniref:Exonuclease family protein n=1 Tax=Leishmania donovani TaxID=5661 RepID=A0A504XVF0_LEIDO|nr:Exonuclease family protein [Leishmania donovani]
MPSSSVQDTFASALDGEGAHVARRARSSSSTSSSARSRSSKRARNSGMRRASSPPATPTIAGATSSALTINVKKKRRHKKARQDEDAAREAARLPPQLPQLCQPHLLHGAPAAPSLLQQRFSEVELQFQLEQDRAQRSALAPRDIANLILWSVPAPVPIIESPRIFFIKNKSKVRNTVVIYVNGWSYDEMLCTGVGLPRARGEVERGGAPREQAAPAMLGPVREGRCWARPGRGTGGAGGVQYCPLSIPSTRNELEKDLWWRNDAPRRPGPSSAASSSALNRWRPNRSCGGEDGDRGVADLHLTSPAVKGARGVGSMFQQAMQVHATGSGAGDGAASAERSPKAASAPAADSPIIASDAFQQHQHLWQNRTLLQRYALHLPEHTVEMQELGFTVSPPQESTAAVRADGGSAEEDDKETALPKGNEERGEQDMVEVEGGESALARATLIDVLTGNVVLDLLVKPRQRITDYRTRFSGIDAATLAPVSTTLADCQHALQRIVDSQTFVVGHSLENDFKACKCIPNCYVLDTTWLFPHPAGLPYKNALRFLAQRYLQRRIQHGSHDSAIDALVSAELTQLKLINGPSFGMRARVSVLGLITEAAGSAADGVRAGEGPEKTTEAGFDVQLHLFDDAVTLASLLPAPQKYDAASATQAGASGGTVSGAPRSSSASSARIDAVPVRHDEDGMRKAVRALQRRASQQAREAAVAANDTDGETATTQRPNFSLFWVQLAQAKVDVVLPPAQPPTASAAVAAEEESETAERAAYAGHGGSRDTGSAHTVAQFRRVHDTNRRVLRIIEACPDETLIVVLTGRCDGEAGGNHFSRAQGTCFAFVKDSSAPGPRPEELTKLTDGSSVSALATAAVPHSLDREAAMVVHTPLACQQQ